MRSSHLEGNISDHRTYEAPSAEREAPTVAVQNQQARHHQNRVPVKLQTRSVPGEAATPPAAPQTHARHAGHTQSHAQQGAQVEEERGAHPGGGCQRRLEENRRGEAEPADKGQLQEEKRFISFQCCCLEKAQIKIRTSNRSSSPPQPERKGAEATEPPCQEETHCVSCTSWVHSAQREAVRAGAAGKWSSALLHFLSPLPQERGGACFRWEKKTNIKKWF